MRAKDWCRAIIITACLLFVGSDAGAGESMRDRPADSSPADASPADANALNRPARAPTAEEPPSASDELEALLNQDLTSLRRTTVAPALDVEVTTVSRHKSTVGRTPAAVFVISQEMIDRSGARTVPELLRMVPGLFVGNIDGSKWSITSRGFADRFANKLLVQIDGRTVYTNLFGGVFWDVQDLLLDDIKRIEVIRGPGAAIWGANAVNGVINIITKSAAETHGWYANAGGGSVQRAFTGARVGSRTQSGVDWRVSGKWYDRDSYFDPTGRANDDSTQGRVYFRTDWTTRSCDQMSVFGGWYSGTNQLTNDHQTFGLSSSSEQVDGGYILGRWSRVLSSDSDMSLQLYYDRADRISTGFDQDINTCDIDFQHRFSPWLYHRFIWGFGYRSIWDRLENTQNPALITVSDQRRTLNWVSAFAQDELALIEDRLYLTIGSKISHNTYTGVEVQPSIRALLLPNDRTALWAAVSRAVRTPTRSSEDIVLQGPPLPTPPFPPNSPTPVLGNRDLVSEELIAYEIGLRRQQTDRWSWDAAWFYNVYEDLQTIESVVPGIGTPFIEFVNDGRAHVHGIEISSEYQVDCGWKVRGWYSYLHINSEYGPDSIITPDRDQNGVPANQAFLMSSWNLNHNLELDLITRYSDVIRFHQVPSYIAMDLRLAWRPNPVMELTVVGQNLLDRYHPEYGSNPFTGEIPTEVPRGVYGMITLRY